MEFLFIVILQVYSNPRWEYLLVYRILVKLQLFSYLLRIIIINLEPYIWV